MSNIMIDIKRVYEEMLRLKEDHSLNAIEPLKHALAATIIANRKRLKRAEGFSVTLKCTECGQGVDIDEETTEGEDVTVHAFCDCEPRPENHCGISIGINSLGDVAKGIKWGSRHILEGHSDIFFNQHRNDADYAELDIETQDEHGAIRFFKVFGEFDPDQSAELNFAGVGGSVVIGAAYISADIGGDTMWLELKPVAVAYLERECQEKLLAALERTYND